ncbi:MAG TPA: sialate O-acetylesterase [Caulobacterales bacterium]|nr:sialate O-acetylesterase [Caulobacterales bacterium]
MASRPFSLWRLIALALTAFACGLAPAFADAPLLHPMFQDHSVLQRDRAVPVWGDAAPGERVTVTLNRRSASARADRQGHWRIDLPAMREGGPYQLSARTSHGRTQTLSDVMVGDVFLCSGQSNMEFGVAGSLYGEMEIAHANNDRIRLLTVAHADSTTPLRTFKDAVSWSPVTPDSVRNFSAACYYFARELQKSVNVPIGLIHSSWGGSAIETWISANGMRAIGGRDAQLDILAAYARDPAEGNRRLGAQWQDWWRHAVPGGGEPWTDASASPNWRPLPEPMRDWKTWGAADLNRNGTVLFRRIVHLTAGQAAQPARLSLGAIDEIDETWVNGQPIGASFGWSTERTYDVPAQVLHEGDNLIVVAVTSTWDMGGMYGPPDHMALALADHSSVPLGGSWSFQAVPASAGYPPNAPWFAINGISPLFNAMIAPIGPYALKGALWYQGESNTGAADQYQALLAGLMRDWRNQFGAGLPFLIVQLPNFGAAPTAPAQSDWASLREAQRRAAEADAHAGLAVTIDVGMNDQLHPPNKQAVGARLARAARHVIYGEAITPSGPRVANAQHVGDAVTVNFADVEGSLVSYSGAPLGFELCGADQSSCRFVAASLRDNAVTLDGASGATRVRYCWGDGPTCNLSDRSGLPAGPFEIAIQ